MKNKLSIIEIFVKYAKPYMGRFITLGLAMLFQSIIKIVLPIINGLVIDEIIYHQNMTVIISLAKLLCIIIITSVIIEFISSLGFWFTQLRFALDIRMDIMKKIYTASGDFLSKMKTGDVVHTVNSDTPQFMNVITDNFFEAVCSLVSCIVVFSYIGYVNKKAMLLITILIFLTLILSRLFGYITKRLSSELREQDGDFISWIFEIIKGIQDIQLLSSEKGVNKMFQQRYKKIIGQKNKILMINVGLERVGAFLTLAMEFSFYILGIYLVYVDEITVGAYIAISTLVTILNQNLLRLSEFFVLLQSRKISLERVQKYLNLSSESDINKGENLVNIKGEIEFKNITFSYEKRPVLSNLYLHIPAGKKIAIVGKNGAGKSTLAYLLLGFYQIKEGSIEIDNLNIQQYSLKSLRNLVGIVQQDILIFSDTLRNNITLGKLYSDEEIWAACEKAAIKDIIVNLPFGLDTVIGNDGFNLSGGQRQRIAVARIILRNPPILIFDEATASLDTESEQQVQAAWSSLSNNKTSIIIAHRLSSILDTDYVAVLKEGKIIAYDHHSVLQKKCPYYIELFYNQYFSDCRKDII